VTPDKTPDDLWIELAQFDTDHADRLWDASGVTDDAPAWYGRVATLLRSAEAPAADDELAGEADIVARMQAAILDTDAAGAGDADADEITRAGTPDHGRPRHLRPVPAAHGSGDRRRQGARVVGRIVAVKAAAVTTAVAVGVTAAAATTGIVATVVVPALQNRDQPVIQEEPPPPGDGGGSTTGPGGGPTDAGSGGDPDTAWDGISPLACIVLPDCDLADLKAAQAAADPEQPAGATDPATAAGDGGDVPADGTTVDDGTAPEPGVPQATPPDTTPDVDPPPDPTPTTTEPPPTTTTAPPPEPTTTTTEPPVQPLGEEAGGGDPPAVDTLSAPATEGTSGDLADSAAAADTTAPAGSPAG
jgi:hypothetical protein